MKAPRIGNAVAALNAHLARELDSRRQATTILQPQEVAGKLSPARLLSTTLGGQLRRITAADLAAFRTSVARLGDKARQGITAQEALALSRPDDIKRATDEIRYSLVSRLQAGTMHIVTNSGPQSKVARHLVTVEFAQFPAALARPGTAAQSAMWLCKSSPLRFACDCEHFRYFLRFVATAGGWVSGRAEHGMPKLTNPTLDGAACKHLLRALTDIQYSVGVRHHVARMIDAERLRVDRAGKAKAKIFQVRQADAERMLPKNARRIVTSSPKRGASLPKPASGADLRMALAAYAGRKDPASAAITRALTALLSQTPNGYQP